MTVLYTVLYARNTLLFAVTELCCSSKWARFQGEISGTKFVLFTEIVNLRIFITRGICKIINRGVKLCPEKEIHELLILTFFELPIFEVVFTHLE